MSCTAIHVPLTCCLLCVLLQPQYVMCFSLGCWMAHHQAFHRLPSAAYGVWSCALGVFIFSVGFVVGQLLSVGLQVPDTTYVNPGLTFFYTFTQQTFAALWGSGLTICFAAWANTQPGALVQRMIGAAYTAYIIHPLIIIIFNRAFVPLPLGPAQFIAVLAFPSFFCTWALSIAITAIPGVNRVL
jgi:surface polysaccharide O-acyltransferase-like enzyme